LSRYSHTALTATSPSGRFGDKNWYLESTMTIVSRSLLLDSQFPTVFPQHSCALCFCLSTCAL